MNLSLNHDDIQVALKNFVKDQIKIADGVTLDINVTCGRGANATSDTVELISKDSLAAGPEKETVVPEKKKSNKKATTPTAEKAEKPEIVEEPDTNNAEETTDEAEVSTTGGLFDE